MLVFYVSVFALGGGLSLVIGAFLGAATLWGIDAELTSTADLDPPLMIAAILTITAGAPVVAILVIALVSGRAGLRDLGFRLLRWRVGLRWYAVALLTAPLLKMTIQGALSLISDAFLPYLLTAEDTASLVVAALAVGPVAAFLEEVAWTGFATHVLSTRHGLLATGLLVGLPWCLLHVPLYAGAGAGAVPWVLAVAAIFFWMLAYRVLIVWVYGHTHSVLLAMLMHLPISVMAFLLASPAMAGVPDLVVNLVFGTTLWVLVAAVAAAERRPLPRPGSAQPRAQTRISR